MIPRYFTLKELCASATATDRGIDNFPTFDAVDHLREFVQKVLDPLRIAWGGPITVTSGYRSPKLNAAVGGVKNSAHMEGYAADLRPASGDIEAFSDFCREWVQRGGIKFDQLIHERNTKTGSVWVHIGLYGPGGCQRGQIILDLIKR